MFSKSIIFTLLLYYPLALNAQENRIKLNKITALIFKKGSITTARRSSSINQMECVGGNACNKYQPLLLMCQNIGNDGQDLIWKCDTTDLPEELIFGSTDVSCEGYDYPDDPYILKGSCGLKYTLNVASTSSHNNGYGFSFLIIAIVAILSCFSNRNQGYSNSDPGFWTGAATGAVLGSLATRNNRPRRSRTPPRARFRTTKKDFGSTKRR